MERYLLLFFCIFFAISCQQNKEYVKNKPVEVPAITHQDPKNPIDTDLIDWKPFGKNVDKSSKTYQEYSSYFPKLDDASLKSRIVVASLEETLKPLEDKFKLALFCSGKFVVVERDIQKYQDSLLNISANQEEALQKLNDSLYSQYLLLIQKEQTQNKWTLYNLSEKKQLHEEMIPEENVLPLVSSISQDVSKQEWKGQIASQPLSDNKVIINAGSLDGVKKGDSFKVEGEEEELIIEEVEEKYATSRIKGMKSLSKGMKIKELKS